MIVLRDNGDNPGKAQNVLAVGHCRSGRFIRIPVAPKVWKKSKAQVNVFQRFPLYETANAKWLTAILQLDQVEAEPKSAVHLNGPVANVILSILEGSYTLIADVLQPRRLIDESKNERGIVSAEPA